MGEERMLRLRRGDIVARRDDHGVGAGEVPEIAILVLAVGVAGDVPAIDDIVGLARIVEISAAGRALDGEAARSRGGEWAVIVAKHAGLVAGHGLAGSAGKDVVARGGGEDVHIHGRADAVDAGRRWEERWVGNEGGWT